MDLDAVLIRISELGASDMHLKLGQPPIVRHDGLIEPLAGEQALTEDALEQVIETITRTAPERHQLFHSSGELDISYECAGTRFRVNAFRQRGSISAVFRVIPRDDPDASRRCTCRPV